ncbi:MAG: Maltodextrin ABC transporter, permease protein MdxG, partial [uncultured Chthoniobacterales bacterium]
VDHHPTNQHQPHLRHPRRAHAQLCRPGAVRRLRALPDRADHHHRAAAGRSVALHLAQPDPERRDARQLPHPPDRDTIPALARQLDGHRARGHRDRRGARLYRRLRTLALPVSRSQLDAQWPARDPDVPGHDAPAAALSHPDQAQPDQLVPWRHHHLRRHGAAVLHLAAEGLLRHDPGLARGGGRDRWLLARAGIPAGRAAAGRASARHYSALFIHDRVERIRRRGLDPPGRGDLHAAGRAADVPGEHEHAMGSLRGGRAARVHSGGPAVPSAQPLSGLGLELRRGQGL